METKIILLVIATKKHNKKNELINKEVIFSIILSLFNLTSQNIDISN